MSTERTEYIKTEKLEIAKLEEELSERKSKLSTCEKELFLVTSTKVFKRCVQIIKTRPSLFRGWRSSIAGSRLVVVYYLYNIAKENQKDIFELLDCVYSFVVEDRTDVPNLEDTEAISEYLSRDEYKIKDEVKIRELPIDTQVLLITKRAYEILKEYGSFRTFARSVMHDQCFFGPN